MYVYTVWSSLHADPKSISLISAAWKLLQSKQQKRDIRGRKIYVKLKDSIYHGEEKSTNNKDGQRSYVVHKIENLYKFKIQDIPPG